jgi:hypothetical protein
MKGKYFLLNFVLLISIIGVLALTASEYVDCKGFYPDEFLDLALAWEYPILPVFAPHLNTYSYLFRSVKIFYFQRMDLANPILRC